MGDYLAAYMLISTSGRGQWLTFHVNFHFCAGDSRGLRGSLRFQIELFCGGLLGTSYFLERGLDYGVPHILILAFVRRPLYVDLKFGPGGGLRGIAGSMICRLIFWMGSYWRSMVSLAC